MIALPDRAATERLGARVAGAVRGGDVIALVGDLGAGKTTLVSGLVEALGGSAASSPTFSLVNEYRGGRLICWHVDLYRIERASELPELGLDDIIGDPRGIVVIEWADRVSNILPADHVVIRLTDAADGSRTATIRGWGSRGQALAEVLTSAR